MGVAMYSGDNFVRDFIIGAAFLICVVSVFFFCGLCIYRIIIGRQHYSVRVVGDPGCQCNRVHVGVPLSGENFHNLL